MAGAGFYQPGSEQGAMYRSERLLEGFGSGSGPSRFICGSIL